MNYDLTIDSEHSSALHALPKLVDEGITDFMAVAFDKGVVACGGRDSVTSVTTNQCKYLDLESKTLQKFPDLRISRQRHFMNVLHDGKIWVTGGKHYDGEMMATFAKTLNI